MIDFKKYNYIWKGTLLFTRISVIRNIRSFIH